MAEPHEPVLPPALLAHIERLQHGGPYRCASCKAPACYLGVVRLPTGKFAVFSVCAACKAREDFVDVEELLLAREAAERN
jgi:hypothetical protein